MKKMQINGFRADVHSDEWIAILRDTSSHRTATAVAQREQPITAGERAALCERADREGYDLVVVERHIYAAYDLRCTMKRRSGNLVRRVEARRNAAGAWYEVKSSSSSFY
jgi:hypothetical protein